MKRIMLKCQIETCRWRGPASACDSVAVLPNTRAASLLGDVLTLAGERRRPFCRKCGEPNVRIEA